MQAAEEQAKEQDEEEAEKLVQADVKKADEKAAQLRKAEEEAAANETADRRVDKESCARGETNKEVASEKPAPSLLWSALFFPILLAMPLLHTNMSRDPCSAVSTS